MNCESSWRWVGSRSGGGATSRGATCRSCFLVVHGLSRSNVRRGVVCTSVSRDVAGPEDRRRTSPDPEGEKGEGRGRWARRHELQRRWVEAENGGSDGRRGRADFAIVSHNILGDHNASKHRDLYTNIPFDYMKWDRRKELIFQDIYQWNADIVCLQEVDRYQDLLKYMRREGYDGIFKQRTGGSTDGCAIFWRENEFHLLEEKDIEFRSFHLRDNIAQLCVFETRKGNTRRFLVGNIHVLFNPNRGEIKLGQIRILLQNAHALAQKRGGIPVVLAGDFNSTPQSAVYEFLSTSELNLTTHDRKYLSGQNKHHPLPFTSSRCLDYSWTNEELRTATGHWGRTQLEHPLKLQSAYASVKGASTTRGPQGEPLATTYHSKFLGTVDYVWYSAGLAPSRVLDTLPLSNLRKIDGLPWETQNLNIASLCLPVCWCPQEIGSDHLALACDFVFTEERAELPPRLRRGATECKSSSE